MQNKISIIDYGMGNLRSVERRFQNVGANVEIIDKYQAIAKADKLVLPGVGHFANGVLKLKDRNMWDILNQKVLIQKTPILGICLGQQLMAKYSEEGDTEGLSWFDASVVKFRINDNLRFKVPHMGWNTISQKKESFLLTNLPQNEPFYFVHSYHIICNDQKDVLTTSNYEYEFCSSIERENIFGVQFHPEKSHEHGDIILRNFMAL